MLPFAEFSCTLADPGAAAAPPPQDASSSATRARALIVPHGAYASSASIAAFAYQHVDARAAKRVVIVGQMVWSGGDGGGGGCGVSDYA